MTNVMKNITASIGIVLASIMLVFASQPTFAWAAGADPEVKLIQSGNSVAVTVVGNGTTTDVRSLALTLNVERNTTNADAVKVDFEFSPAMQKLPIHQSRVVAAGTMDRMQIYVAGGANLLDGDLDLGRVVYTIDTALDPTASVSVSIPESGALRTIDDSYNEKARSVYSTTGAEGVILPGEENPDAGLVPGENGPLGDLIQGAANFLGGDGEKLSQTGDIQTLIMGGLLVVVAVALLVMSVMLFFRKKKNSGSQQ